MNVRRLCRLLSGLVVLAAMCATDQVTAQQILFEETFDSAGLPTSLTYISDPNFNRWVIDGSNQLFGEKLLGGGGDILAAISVSGFNLGSGGLLYSADMGRPLGTVPGGSNIRLLFGEYNAIFHPGHPTSGEGDLGAFRLEKGLFGGELLIPNQDMGFIPALKVLHHVKAFVQPQGGSLAIDITISGIGTDMLMHSYNVFFVDNSPGLGSGEIGVAIQGTNPPGTNDGFFDNLEVHAIPEPSSLLLCSFAVAGLIGLGWRRRKRAA